MGSAVIHSDIVLFLTTWFRAAIAARPEAYCQGVRVSNKETDLNKGPLVVILDNSGPRLSVISAERTIGISVLAGTKDNPKPAVDLALMVEALCSRLPGLQPGNPVAAVTETRGPFAVAEASTVARQYLTVDLIVTGTPL